MKFGLCEVLWYGSAHTGRRVGMQLWEGKSEVRGVKGSVATPGIIC